MLRSMYSGVSGMKAHQSKMDVIGNNIANVNTYGFKASRTTFSEVYYQTTKSASGASANAGGTNASQIGYGVNVAGIDVMHTRSGFQMTDNGMDVAIAGEGFFQVQDADGNIFYTRAGMIRIDSNGNMVDQNGNFVLGVSGDPLGRNASSERITIQVPSVNPQAPNVSEIINGLKYTITGSNETKDGNVSFNFTSSKELPLGQKVEAKVTSNGINITLNENETFANEAELNQLINEAVTAANGGKEHPGGIFTIQSETPWANLTGKEIAGSDYSPVLGSVALPSDITDLGFKFSSVGNGFSGTGAQDYTVAYNETNDAYDFSVIVDGKTYAGSIPSTATSAGKLKLTSDQGDDYIIVEHPGFTALETKREENGDELNITATSTQDAKASEASKQIGLGSKSLTLSGGTSGGDQSVSDLTNIGIGPDGVITAIHPQKGLISIGRIDIATFDNPQGLIQEGNTYFSVSANSGGAKLSNAGLGGAGGLQAGALEMSNVDLSKEFADMITTQRGFQASSRLITVSDEILNELVNLKR
ncbi:MAG: flagellar basal-body rod protein FlgF [Erysipelotrichaceae bacterium]